MREINIDLQGKSWPQDAKESRNTKMKTQAECTVTLNMLVVPRILSKLGEGMLRSLGAEAWIRVKMSQSLQVSLLSSPAPSFRLVCHSNSSVLQRRARLLFMPSHPLDK